MPFITHLDARAVGDRDWMLLGDLVYRYKCDGLLCMTVTVPKGFVTDLASMPWAIRWLLPVNDRHRPAAVLHDFMYRDQKTTRAEADALFYVAMEECGVPRWKRDLIYAGVRTGGWAAWKSNQKKFGAPS